MKSKKINKLNVLSLKGDHKDITIEITLLCLERCLYRIKSQIKYSEINGPEQLKGNLQDFKKIKQAIKIVKHYK